MADLTAKIGSDSSQFRADVGSRPGVVKDNFGKMKTASDGGLADNVKGLKKGFTELRELLVGGGIVEGVKRFFDFAIDAANKSTNANDMNAAAVRRFGESFTELKTSAGSVAVFMLGTINRLGEAFGDLYLKASNGVKGNTEDVEKNNDVLDETSKALREQEKARAAAFKHEPEFKQISAEIKQLTEARTDLEMKSLTLAQQRDILQTKMMTAQRQEMDAEGNKLESRKAQLEQIKVGNQLLTVQNAINDQSAQTEAKRSAEAYARQKTEIEALPLAEKELLLTQQIADQENIIKSGVLETKAADAAKVQLADRQNELLKTQNKIFEEANKLNEAQVQLSDKKRESAREELTAQVRFNVLKSEEAQLISDIAEMDEGEDKIKAENRLLGIQNQLRSAGTDQAKADAEISALLSKGKENLNEVEKERLKLLMGETTEIKQQEELHELVAKQIAGPLTDADQKRLDVLRGQTAEVTKQKDEMAETLKLVQARVSVEQTSHGDSYSGMSAASLQGTLSRLYSKLADAQAADTMAAYHVGGTYHSPEMAQYQNDIAKIEAELRQRNEIESYARRYGDEATRSKYGDTLAEKALNDVRDAGNQTAKSLQNIEGRIANSPFFPAQ